MERIDPFTTDSGDIALVDSEHLLTLLRAERAAVGTYEDALAHLGHHLGSQTLKHIHGNHRDAVDWLRERLRHADVSLDEATESWSAFASLMTGHELVGMATILATLKQGEQHVLNEYEEAVRSGLMDEECREHVQSRRIPDGHRHLLELDHLLAQDSRS